MSIEAKAVNAVARLIEDCAYLESRFSTNDKTVSFDGVIEVYRKAEERSSKDYVMDIPVQIKGKTFKKEAFPKKWHFSVRLSDLNNYVQRGGVIFFVVLIRGKSKKVYYAALLPYELRLLLGAKGKGSITRNIDLFPFPELSEDIDDLILNFAEDLKKQSTSKHLSSDEIQEILEKTNYSLNASIGFVTSQKDKYLTPCDYLFSNPVYVYADLSYGVKVPIFRSTLQQIRKRLNVDVVIGDKIFYSSLVHLLTKEEETVIIGKCFILKQNRKTKQLNVRRLIKGTLNDRISGLKFLSAIIQHKKLEIGDLEISFQKKIFKDDEKMLQEQALMLHELEDLRKALNMLDYNDDLNLSSLTEEDDRNLHCLVSRVLQDESFPLSGPDVMGNVLEIGSLKLAVFAQKDFETQLYRLKNFNDFVGKVSIKDDAGVVNHVSPYPGMPVEFIKNAQNVNFLRVVDRLTNNSDETKDFPALTIFLLKLLLAFDSSDVYREDIIKAAQNLSHWLLKNDTRSTHFISLLNYFQVVKRMRPLQPSEIDDITKVIEDVSVPLIGKVGAYLLLDMEQSSLRNFQKLEKNDMENFLTFPICRFMKDRDAFERVI